MASPTAVTSFIRERKKSKQGKKRKAKLRREGSTKSLKTLFGE